MVSFMEHDVGFFDDERGRIERAEPFDAEVLPMRPV
jgi:hypothetical protein